MPALQLPPELVVLDVETTGLEPELGHSVVELAAQKIHGHEVVGEFMCLVDPGYPMSPEASAIHGITPEMIALDGRPVEEAILEFVDFIGDAGIVGHNIGFDMSFINAHLVRLGRKPLTNPTLDTLALAKRYLIIPSYSLKNVAAYLKVQQPHAHRALIDVITTREVLFKLIERAKTKT